MYWKLVLGGRGEARSPLVGILLAAVGCVFALGAQPVAASARAETPRTAPESPAAGALREALGPGARVFWSQDDPRPTALRGLDLETAGTTPSERARDFLSRYAEALRVDGLALRPTGAERTRRAVVVRLAQEHEGVPVQGRGATVVFDATGERVRAVTLEVADVILPTDRADIGPEAAVEAARREAKAVLLGDARASAAKRILAGPPSQEVYQVVLPTIAPFGRVSIFVDAATGALVWQRRDAIR